MQVCQLPLSLEEEKGGEEDTLPRVGGFRHTPPSSLNSRGSILFYFGVCGHRRQTVRKRHQDNLKGICIAIEIQHNVTMQ